MKSAKRKLLNFGATLIDNEYVSIQELETLLQEKIRKIGSGNTSFDLAEKSSFKEFL